MASFEQNQKNKMWSVRFRIVENGLTINKRLSGFRTKKEANEAYAKYINEKPKNTTSKSRKFSEIYCEYLQYKEPRLKASSYYDLRTKCNLHILPFFKNFDFDKIAPKDIMKWQNSLSGMSYKYKTCLRSYLSNILNYLDRYYDIPNKINKVEPFRNLEAPKEMLFWTSEEFTTFIKYVDKIQYKAYFSFLYLTGCRKGEALALTWDDINFLDNKVVFNKNITRKVQGKSWAITTTKNTYSNRTISLPDNLIKLLEEYKKWQAENFKEILFVFCGSSPFADTNIERVFSNYCKLANVKRIRIHDFRHSHASYLISEGFSIVAVGTRLGHKNKTVTLNTYSHFMPTEDTRLLNKLNIDL